MSRISYIGRDENDKAIWVPTGSPEHQAYLAGISAKPSNFIGDEGDFISPIDGKVYSGKAGMREHNRRHDVINNRDLTGLPVGVDPKRATAPPTTRQRQELRQAIYDAAMRGRYLEGQ